MVSHKNLGGLDLSIGKGGLRFKKRASGFNNKIGKCMVNSGAKPTNGGRYDKGFQSQFTKCVEQSK